MHSIGIMLRIAVVYLLLVTAGCAHCTPGKEDMYTLAAALTKLTAAVEEKVYFREAPADMNDMELVNFSTSHDPRLKAPFAEYHLKARGVDGHAILLVCDRNGARGLIEDGGCTAAVDRHWWQDQPDHPCEISPTICQTP